MSDERPKLEAAMPSRATDNRVSYRGKGRIDEIVTDAGGHLEHLGAGRWFLSLQRTDGTSCAVWIEGKITGIEEREAPTCRSCGSVITPNDPSDGGFLMCPGCGWSARADLEQNRDGT